MFLERAHGGNGAAGAKPARDAAEPHRGGDDAAAEGCDALAVPVDGAGGRPVAEPREPGVGGREAPLGNPPPCYATSPAWTLAIGARTPRRARLVAGAVENDMCEGVGGERDARGDRS